MGGVGEDRIIRIYDFKKAKEEQLQHTIRCNSAINSISWRKNKVSTNK